MPHLILIVDSLASEYVSRAILGLRAPMEAAGWSLRVREVGHLLSPERLELLQKDLLDSPKAVVYIHFHLHDEDAALLRSAGVLMGLFGGDQSGVHCVVDDGNEGAYKGTLHLIGMGHKRIAQFSGSNEILELRLREAGFKRALKEKGLIFDRGLLKRLRLFTREAGRDAALEMLQEPVRPTAIFSTAGDEVAQGVYEAATQLGMRIPADLAVMGYDDLNLTMTLTPPLSSISQPLEEMGELLARDLLAAAQDSKNEPGRRLLKPLLVARESTGDLPWP